MKYVFTAAVVAALTFIGCVSKETLPAYSVRQENLNREYNSIIRLHDDKDRFVCSGVVISDDYVLTAAHCLYGNDGPVKTINVISSANTTTKASVVGLNVRMDYALLRGNFTKFTREILMFSSGTPLRLTGIKGRVFTCGFPFGSKQPFCYGTAPQLVDTQSFQLVLEGALYPGMSGGPVIDVDNGLVIGVNSAVTRQGGGIVISPLIGLFDSFKIEVKE